MLINVMQVLIIWIFWILLTLNYSLKILQSAGRNKLIDALSELRGFEFVTALVVEFKLRESDDATKYIPFYSNSKAETIINESDIIDGIWINLHYNYIKHTKIS